MIKLKPFSEQDCQNLVDWNSDKPKEFLLQWAGSIAYQYPISATQVSKRRHNETLKMFAIYDDETMVGSVELVLVDGEPNARRICRFIMSDKYKHRGYGEQALRELTKLAFEIDGVTRLTLNVACFNLGALRCYLKCGFLPIEFRQPEGGNAFYVMELKHNQ